MHQLLGVRGVSARRGEHALRMVPRVRCERRAAGVPRAQRSCRVQAVPRALCTQHVHRTLCATRVPRERCASHKQRVARRPRLQRLQSVVSDQCGARPQRERRPRRPVYTRRSVHAASVDNAARVRRWPCIATALRDHYSARVQRVVNVAGVQPELCAQSAFFTHRLVCDSGKQRPQRRGPVPRSTRRSVEKGCKPHG